MGTADILLSHSHHHHHHRRRRCHRGGFGLDFDFLCKINMKLTVQAKDRTQKKSGNLIEKLP